MYKKKFSLAVFVVLIILLFSLISGCSLTKTKGTYPTNKPVTESTLPVGTTTEGKTDPTTKPIPTVKLTLYFPNQDASWLIAVERNVSVPEKEVIKTIFKELDSPPPNFSSSLPKGTTLLGATVKDGIATLNLSQEFQKNFSGGTSAEQMTLFSIVNSLTTLSNVQSVQFLLEGQNQDAMLGHMDTSVPIKRNETIIKKIVS
ncbi:MAG: GerMN domain-containing protein [Desulfitobacteriaceae bacterium]